MKKPRKLFFGTAGVPHSAKGRGTKDGIIQIKTLGLDAMELEFVRRISLTEKSAKDVYKIAHPLNILLTVHAPYYINLASPDEKKIEASIERIYMTAKVASIAGSWSLCFHAGYYMDKDPIIVYEIIKKNIEKVIKRLQDESIEIWIRPETTGKLTQFGTIEEVLKLSTELEMVMPVIDFAHIHARFNGKYNSEDEFRSILMMIEKYLGKTGLRNMHIHVSGIEYNEKGEVRHLNLEESDLRYIELLKILKEFKVRGVLICESPNLEEDALLLKKTYRSL
ncbi:MAG: TIM barrel protein [Thermoproteales archaeon]|nr:TIM barrel protein [Thermoproteales archaeon]